MVTALAPIIWGTTYVITTELLPPGRPLLAAVLRALPAGVLLIVLARRLPRGIWWWRALVLGALNTSLTDLDGRSFCNAVIVATGGDRALSRRSRAGLSMAG